MEWESTAEPIDLNGDGVADDLSGDGVYVAGEDDAWVVCLIPAAPWRVPNSD